MIILLIKKPPNAEKSAFVRNFWHPQRESNARFALRRGMLYPLNYEGRYTSLCIITHSDDFFKCFFYFSAEVSEKI